MLFESTQKVKQWMLDNRSDLYIALIIFLVGLASFGLGRLSVLWPEKEAIEITMPDARNTTHDNQEDVSEQASAISGVMQKGEYVASKNGVAYHYPWCSGALRIKEENKVWFVTKEDAERAGYRAAANCEGL